MSAAGVDRFIELGAGKVLTGELLQLRAGADVTTVDISGAVSGVTADLLVNATPCGMFPHTDESPVNEDFFRRQGAAYVFDAIYNPAETQLLRSAKAHGAKTLGGIPMLVYQAALAQEIWHGRERGSMFREEDLQRLCGLVQAEITG
ncbi:hypothetical protein FACS1894120_4870 [Clostridia bacterium]|nr:hypothetical protein FACS1894120_4870 [Clostridia bacterium]